MAIFNLVGSAGQCLHVGLSTDTKPASVNGMAFLEIDTSKLFLRSGGAWVEETNNSYPILSGGLIPLANLGTGTPDNTKFLRGDATWQTVSGGTSKGSFGITIDGGGSVITTGLKGFITVPFDMTITGWDILADQSGSIVIDVWKDTYANFPPTIADTIAGTEKPTLSSQQKNQDASLSTWTTTVAEGDVIAFNVDSVSTVTRVTLVIYGDKI